jgi:hypothetical protein
LCTPHDLRTQVTEHIDCQTNLSASSKTKFEKGGSLQCQVLFIRQIKLIAINDVSNRRTVVVDFFHDPGIAHITFGLEFVAALVLLDKDDS